MVEVIFGVKAERQSLENIARPLTAQDADADTGSGPGTGAGARRRGAGGYVRAAAWLDDRAKIQADLLLRSPSGSACLDFGSRAFPCPEG